MNKSMLIGVVAGVGIATAGGVLGYQFVGQQKAAEVADAAEYPQQAADDEVVVARAEPARASAARAPAAKPAPQSAPRTAAAAPTEECWDAEVTVQNDPKDSHQIAGTALGAVVGGAIGKDVGDRNLTTAAGAAAGAFIGRKIQQHVQENQAEKRTVTKTERRCGPVGTPH
jgi:uncharacterized protein YcfJ